jgi:hypothetical protein
MDTSKQQAGSLGGRETVRKYGPKHMAEIGKRGAAVTWARYSLAPVGSSGWAMVERNTGTIRALSGYNPRPR